MADKITIALDVDGVLADFNIRLCYVLQNDFNIFVEPSDIQQWDFQFTFGITQLEAQNLMSAIFNSNEHFPLINGARAGVEELIQRGYNLIIVTARMNPENLQEWLKLNNLAFIPTYHINLEGCPSFDYLLDDSPKKIADLQKKTKRHAFLLSSPQNTSCLNLFNKYTRVADWESFLVALAKREKNRKELNYEKV